MNKYILTFLSIFCTSGVYATIMYKMYKLDQSTKLNCIQSTLVYFVLSNFGLCATIMFNELLLHLSILTFLSYLVFSQCISQLLLGLYIANNRRYIRNLTNKSNVYDCDDCCLHFWCSSYAVKEEYNVIEDYTNKTSLDVPIIQTMEY